MSRTYRSRKMHGYTNIEKYMRHLSHYGLTSAQAHEEWYKAQNRDGKPSDSSAKRGYRNYANAKIRNDNKVFVAKFKYDDEHAHNCTYADKKNGKHYARAIW